MSVLLTIVAKRLAVHVGLIAQPVEDRYHRTVIPLGGGIAIFSTISIVILSAIITVKLLVAPGYLDWLGSSVTIHTEGFISKIGQLVIILLLVFLLFALGLWDDKKYLSPFFKLTIHFIIALIAAYFADIRFELFIESKIVTSLLSAVWIVLIINAFNFLDNMDGASAGIATIISCILLTAAALSGQVFVGGLTLVFIGTLSGFLVFNFPPAKIFMGDAGSLVVGFFVALLTVRTTYYHQAQSGQWYPVFMPLLVMAVPLYDFISVTLLRISQGKSPFIGDTQHFSHRLQRRGLSDTQTVLTLYLATLCTGLGAISLYQVNQAGAILIIIQTVMVLSIIAILETASQNDKKAD